MTAVTADSYGPFDSGPGRFMTIDQWSLYMRQLLTNGVLLGELNELEPYGDGSGMQVKCKTGNAFLRGFFGRWSSSDPVVAVTSNGSGQTRIDLFLVRLNMTTKLLELDVKAGTAGASPVPPALQQDATIWEEPIAQVRLASGVTSVTATMVTDARRFTRPRGVELGRPVPTLSTTVANNAEIFFDGRTVSRVTYQELFDMPGGAYVAGPGDGATTFQVPDFRRVVPAGYRSGDADFGAGLGRIVGAARVTLTVAQLPTHNHGGITGDENNNHWHGYSQPAAGISAINSDSVPAGGWANKSVTNVWQQSLANTGITGGVNVTHKHPIPPDGNNEPHPVIQPTILVNYVVRAR